MPTFKLRSSHVPHFFRGKFRKTRQLCLRKENFGKSRLVSGGKEISIEVVWFCSESETDHVLRSRVLTFSLANAYM